MPVTFREDLIAASRFSMSSEGYSQQRRFKVFGVDTIPAPDVGFVVMDELAAQKQVDYGTAHPSIPGMYTTSIQILPSNNAKAQANALVGYSDFSMVRVTVDASVSNETTEIDVYGKPITVLYLPTKAEDGKKRYPPGFYPEKSQYGCESSGLIPVEVLRPGMTLEFERWVIDRAGMISQDLKFLEGATNASRWQNSNEFTWLCTTAARNGSVLRDGQDRPVRTTIWREKLQFKYKGKFEGQQFSLNNNWDLAAYYVDPRFGQTPSDVDPKADGFPTFTRGNGWRIVQPYSFANFDLFNLPTVFT